MTGPEIKDRMEHLWAAQSVFHEEYAALQAQCPHEWGIEWMSPRWHYQIICNWCGDRLTNCMSMAGGDDPRTDEQIVQDEVEEKSRFRSGRPRQ